jgi:hypothetical protein
MENKKVEIKSEDKFIAAKESFEEMQEMILPYSKPRKVINTYTHGLWGNKPIDINNKNSNSSKNYSQNS